MYSYRACARMDYSSWTAVVFLEVDVRANPVDQNICRCRSSILQPVESNLYWKQERITEPSVCITVSGNGRIPLIYDAIARLSCV